MNILKTENLGIDFGGLTAVNNFNFEINQNETIKFTMDPVVSSDVIGRNIGALVDGLSTSVLNVNGKQLVKVVAWYDNEMGYSTQMVRTAKYLASLMNK